MAQANNSQLDDVERQIFELIAKKDVDGFKQLVIQLKDGVDFVDADGMTPLQHACCKGNKEAVQILLDLVSTKQSLLVEHVLQQASHRCIICYGALHVCILQGADITFNRHGADYTPLHFAALSGNTEVCRMLLDAGINPSSLNSVSRTASQMAAFVGNHSCAETINNYVPRSTLEYYTQPQGQQKSPLIPPAQLDAFHAFVIEVNLHPVRIALNLQSLGLLKHLPGLKKALIYMCEKEMKKSNDVNELLAFKFHYLSWIVSELMRCEEQCKAQRKDKPVDGETGKNDFVELFIKRVLKENKLGQLDYIEFTLRDCVREFPFRECTIFGRVVSELAAKEPLPALSVLREAVNGHRGFTDETTNCSSCGNEKPDKKCSKCKVVKYCDRECQRLHWFMHKKACARLTSNTTTIASTSGAKEAIDTNELRQELAKLATN